MIRILDLMMIWWQFVGVVYVIVIGWIKDWTVVVVVADDCCYWGYCYYYYTQNCLTVLAILAIWIPIVVVGNLLLFMGYTRFIIVTLTVKIDLLHTLWLIFYVIFNNPRPSSYSLDYLLILSLSSNYFIWLMVIVVVSFLS